ncbi:MAG: hypothetical protein IH602_05595 [Bryobacteraceae bacterium]|nr:hypothetical protein [Bryobacteraceae bacterium]
MKHEYNPKNFLRIASPDLLQTYFEQRGLLASYNWESCDAESLFALLSEIPPDVRQAVSVDFQNVFVLACKKGIATLIDAGRAQGVDLAAVEKGRASIDKVLRVLIDHPAVFQLACSFVWADGLQRYWYRRRDFPPPLSGLKEPSIAALQSALSAYYSTNEGRGEFCQVEVHERNGVDYVMVYLADYPSAIVCFEGSNQLKRSFQRRAFDVVFKLDRVSGGLELYAEGTRQLREDLAGILVRSIHGETAALDDDAHAVFDLDRLKDPEFRFKIDPSDGIKSMKLRSMRLGAPGIDGGRITFTAPPRSREYRLHRFIDRGLNNTNYPLATLKVEHVTIHAQMLIGNPRPMTVTFNLSSSNSCNLKDTPEHNGIRECLKRSEILRG